MQRSTPDPVLRKLLTLAVGQAVQLVGDYPAPAQEEQQEQPPVAEPAHVTGSGCIIGCRLMTGHLAAALCLHIPA